MGGRKPVAISLVVLFSIFVLAACQQDEPGVEAARESNSRLLPVDQEFLERVAASHQAEIQIAGLAQQKSANLDVKRYAQILADDHEKDLATASNLLQKYNTQVPGILPSETQRQVDTMSPEAFDPWFVNATVQNYHHDISIFQEHSLIAGNPDVKEYIDSMLPQLQRRLEGAQEFQSKFFLGETR